jgi:uncharacterized membrane protein
MNLPHIHLLLNHFPIIGTIIALALYVFALIGKSEDLKRAAMVIFAGIALLAIPTYMSGNGAEESIRKMPEISKAAVAAHNNAALVSLIFVELTGIFAWLALWQSRRFRHTALWTLSTVLLLSVATLYFMTVTGNTGGEIRHSEIHSVKAAAAEAGAPEPLLDATAVSMFVTGTKWMWPTCETLHFVGLSLLMGVVLLVDLRMMGMMKSISFPVLHRLLPWGILGFAMNVLTGLLFFIGNPEQYTKSVPFQWKMALVLVAGANALYFTMFDEVWVLASGDEAPVQAKLAAGSAVVLWVAIMWCGNMLPFIGDSF